MALVKLTLLVDELDATSNDEREDIVQMVSAAWFEAGAAGILEEDAGPSVYAQSETELLSFQRAAAAVLGDVRSLLQTAGVSDDYQSTWLSALQPVEIADAWVLRPTSCGSGPPGEQTLWFEPSVSFGSGEHPTTQLAASAVARIAQRRPGQSLLDVGAGNGVLCLVARAAGFGPVVALDTDPIAIASCQKNFELNQLERCSAVLGSADASEESFDVVVANIVSAVLEQLAAQLWARTRPGGELVLAGLLDEDAPRVLARYTELGFVPLENASRQGDASRQGWRLLQLHRPD